MTNPFLDPDNNPIPDSDSKELAKISPQKKREIQKLFMILLTIGLVIGSIVSFAIVKALNKLGLTDKTPQFERIQTK